MDNVNKNFLSLYFSSEFLTVLYFIWVYYNFIKYLFSCEIEPYISLDTNLWKSIILSESIINKLRLTGVLVQAHKTSYHRLDGLNKKNYSSQLGNCGSKFTVSGDGWLPDF